MTTVTPRLDLDENVLERAKKAIARSRGLDPETTNMQDIAFSDTMETALQRYENKILECLGEAGFRRQEVKRGRPRRVRRELWQHLEQRTEEFDVSRIGLLRAALALLAAEYADGASAAPDNTDESSQVEQLSEE